MQNNNQYSFNLNASSYVPKNKGQYNQQYNNNNYNNQGYNNNNYQQQEQHYQDNKFSNNQQQNYQDYNNKNNNNYNNTNYYYDKNAQNNNNYQDYSKGNQNENNQQGYYQDYNQGKGKKNYPNKNEFNNTSANNNQYEVEKQYVETKFEKGGKILYNKNQNYQKENENYYNDNSNYYGNNKKDFKNTNKKDNDYNNYPEHNENQTWNNKNNNNFKSNKNNNYGNYDNSYKNYDITNKNSNYSNYDNQNENYNDNYNKKGKNNKNFNEKKQDKLEKIEVIQRIVDPKSGKQTVQVVHKEYTQAQKPVFNQDLEDDFYDEETLGESNFNDDADELYDDEGYDFGDRPANYGDYNDLDDPFGDEFGGEATKGKKGFQSQPKVTGGKFHAVDSLTDKFSNKLNLNNANDANASNDYPKKTELTFANNECFTDHVDKLLVGENKKYSQDITDSYVNVLMIAEKPSIARSISEALCSGKYNTRTAGRGKNIISFEGFFGNAKARFTVSSVMGHVYTSDFKKEHNQWSAIDALDLYEVPIVKQDANPKTRIPAFISSLATGKDILCLWLDCDKEGENICFEVINDTFKYMNRKPYQQIYRAKFSSLTKQDLKVAFNNLRERPNKFESLSVDVRQVIDLKIGVSFTRFLTSSILPGLKDEEIKLLSYGPCQTPTLWFCVNRQKEIHSFVPKEYFRIYTDVEVKKIKKKIYYEKNFYDRKTTDEFLRKFQDTKKATVVSVDVKVNQKTAPAGMNTVQMLRIASSYLKISPHHTMVIAEKLYTMGYVTYPRTETTKYAPSFDFKKALSDFASHSVFGQKINTHIMKNYQRPILKGVDVGDHPPITPAKVADQSELKGDFWRLYELICTNFFASLAPPAEYEERVNTILIENEVFVAESMNIVKDGFLAFMPWKRGNYMKDFPVLTKDQEINISAVSYEAKWTEPPSFLSESDLIKLMEKNKIGTDASMPVHIENICNRGYVEVDEGRKLIPTNLGKALIESLSIVDPELVKPTARAEIESMVDSIAKGKKPFTEILKYSLDLYKNKFLLVRQNYEKMIAQFRRYFTVDTAGITNISKNIKKQNTEYRLQTQVKKSEREIQESILRQSCIGCKKGKMYVDYDAFDKFILLCTACKFRKKLIRDAVKIDLEKDYKCPECNSNICTVEIQFPLITGEKKLTGCLFCDDRLNYGL